MQLCGISLSPAETVAIAGIATTLLSEAIAASPLRENSIVQIGLSLFKGYTRRIGADTPRLSGQKAPGETSPAKRRPARRRPVSGTPSQSESPKASPRPRKKKEQ